MGKIWQILVFLGYLFFIWKGLNGFSIDMATITNWSANSLIFWILWGIEAAVMLWWLLTDMQQTYLPVNPMVFVGWAYLALALLLFLLNFRVIALILVGIGMVPLAIMALFMLIFVLFAKPGSFR